MYTPDELRGFEEALAAIAMDGCDTDKLSPDAKVVMRIIMLRPEETKTKAFRRLQQELPCSQRAILVGIITLLTGNRSGKFARRELGRYDTFGKMGNEARLEDRKSRMREKLVLRQQAKATQAAEAEPQAEAVRG